MSLVLKLTSGRSRMHSLSLPATQSLTPPPSKLKWLALSGLLVISLTSCATPGERGAGTGAALGGGIAMLAGASPVGILGGALVGGGVGYVTGKNTNLFR